MSSLSSSHPPIKSCLHDVTVDDITKSGLSSEDAATLYRELKRVCAARARLGAEAEIWKELMESGVMKKPGYDHRVHQLVYYSNYGAWDVSARGPPPYWFPSKAQSIHTNLGRIMEIYGSKLLGSQYQNPVTSFNLFQKFSVEHRDVYWSIIVKELAIKFHIPPISILDNTSANWFPGAMMNIAESCLIPRKMSKDDSIAIVWRDENCDDSPVNYITRKELRGQVIMVANALDTMFTKGDAIAIDIPMTHTAVIIYLAIVLAGYTVVSIAESFAAKEIATRMKISNAKGIFTQDFIIRGGKKFPLYNRVKDACLCKAVVIPSLGNDVAVTLRDNDISWREFMSLSSNISSPLDYSPVYQPMESTTNIIFSSGTTGDPKAIPWTHISPIRSAADLWAHLDVQSSDTLCWYTSLGWVAGSIVLYSCLLTGATLALFNGSPLGRSYGKFVQDAGVTILGTVPSLVKTWKSSNCMEGLNWTKIKAFASTGEASGIDDDLWLSSQAGYAPIIECCGGTELASSYLQGSMLQPQAFAAFSTPGMSAGFVILDDHGNPYPDDEPSIGEVGLYPVYMGASNKLLNADHYKVYFEGMPIYKGMRLRRHGDIVERTVGGYYIVHGRADDTMNLRGIKTSSVEIERVCNKADERALETAAVAIKFNGGGPEQLVVFAVLKSGSSNFELNILKAKFQNCIQRELNPLFKVSLVKIVDEFPRTASNKLLRRVLRDQLKQESKL